jgi:hypothetical protein
MGIERTGATLLAIALVVFAPASGKAAEFQLATDLSSSNGTPDDNTAPCLSVTAHGADVDDTGGAADFDSDGGAEALGNDPSCNLTAQASSSARGLFNLIPNGENPGDEVPVCVHVDLANAAAVTGNATATVARDVILVEAISGNGRRPILRIPEKSFTAENGEKRLDEFACSRQVTMAVGEQLEGRIGGTVTVKIPGVGGSEASFDFEMAAFVGGCNGAPECPLDVPAPAISHAPLAALAGLLLLSGVGLRMRRRRRT